MKKDKITIAIDGFSSCGKSTLAKALASELGYIFIDTGAMYRAVALYCFNQGWITTDGIDESSVINNLDKISLHFERNLKNSKLEIFLNNCNVEKEIRTLEISQLVSKIASIKQVRSKLVFEQQKMGENGGVVMDGRDIGSVVFPNAELKLFVTASPEIRVERRYKELLLTEPTISKDAIKANLEERDYLDTTRTESPLIQTDDAILLDNSNLNQDQQLSVALNLVKERL
ncbi:MAG: (d)CMP kinase [Crocinitomicaceae bacterium]|nr:(d)CMP kinase [Crocinitomicaceae bacterium]